MLKTGVKVIKNPKLPVADIKRILKAIYQFPTLSTVSNLTKLMELPEWKVQNVFDNKARYMTLFSKDELKKVEMYGGDHSKYR